MVLEVPSTKSQCSERFKRSLFSCLQFLSDEVEIIFWESKAKRSKLFKSKLGDRKLLRKWFYRYFQLNTECSERFKRALLSSFQIFG